MSAEIVNLNEVAHEAKLIVDGIFASEDVRALGASMLDGPIVLQYPAEARDIVLQPEHVAAWAAVRGISQQALLFLHQARPKY